MPFTFEEGMREAEQYFLDQMSIEKRLEAVPVEKLLEALPLEKLSPEARAELIRRLQGDPPPG